MEAIKKGGVRKAYLIVAAAAVAALVLGLVVKSALSGKTATEGTAKYTVKRGPLDIKITETGEIQAADNIKITPEIQGQATIVELVEEGARVKKGDVLVQLDKSQLEQDAANMEITVENSQADLTRAEEQRKIQELTNSTDIAKAQLAVQAAEMEVAKYGTVLLNAGGFLATDSYLEPGAPEMGEAYQQFRDAELAIMRAETDLERAESNFEGMDELLAKGFVTKNDFISEELSVLEAERKVESMQLAHFILRTYTYPKTLAQKASDLQQANNRLTQVELSATSEMTQRDVAITEAKTVYDMKLKQLQDLKDRIEKMTILAPEDGLVLYGDPTNMWGNTVIEIGSTVNRGQTILTLPKVTSMVAATKVLERDVNKVKAGQTAIVRMPALPDLNLVGTVAKVSSVTSSGQRWWMASEVKTFDVEVTLDTADPRMRPGMSCDVDIEVETLPDVLYVPVNAIFKGGSGYVCYVLSGGSPAAKRVTVGESNDLYVEVTSGLEDGDDVLLYSVTGASGQLAEAAQAATGGRPSAPSTDAATQGGGQSDGQSSASQGATDAERTESKTGDQAPAGGSDNPAGEASPGAPAQGSRRGGDTTQGAPPQGMPPGGGGAGGGAGRAGGGGGRGGGRAGGGGGGGAGR